MFSATAQPVPAAEFRKERLENEKQAVHKNARRNAGHNKVMDEAGENDGQRENALSSDRSGRNDA